MDEEEDQRADWEHCFICGRFFPSYFIEDHESECEEKMAESTPIRVKTIPELTNILKSKLKNKE